MTNQPSLFTEETGLPLFSIPDAPAPPLPFQVQGVNPSNLVIGKVYQYDGNKFRHTKMRYVGTADGFYGIAYDFETTLEGWHVGGGYRLSPDSLKDVHEVTQEQQL